MLTLGFSAVRVRNSSIAPVFSRASSRNSAMFLGFRGRPALFGDCIPLRQCHAGVFESFACVSSDAGGLLSPFSSSFIRVVLVLNSSSAASLPRPMDMITGCPFARLVCSGNSAAGFAGPVSCLHHAVDLPGPRGKRGIRVDVTSREALLKTQISLQRRPYTDDFEELAPPHYRPRGRGRAIVTGKIEWLGVLHVRFRS